MSQANDVDLEIGLSWDRQADALRSFVRIDRPGSATDQWKLLDDPLDIKVEQLRDLEPDLDEYGSALGRMLLGRQDIGQSYAQARQAAESEPAASLHIRLHMNVPAKYHAVRWEVIREPDSGQRIATKADVLLSRYLSSADWRAVPTRPKHELRALAVVAAPSNIGEWQSRGRPLGEVDRDGELERARAALDGMDVTPLASDGDATMANLLDAVEDGVDVLYLVCHGSLTDNIPQLFLERADGKADPVNGIIFAERLADLHHRPTVAMLCSCQSAARGDELWTDDRGVIAALGPRLARAGVAAVIAMQHDFSMDSAKTFVPRFFEELRKHGEVDRATATARRVIQDRPDWWVPVLYSRLRSGRTYYTPEFTGDADTIWRALGLAMRRGRLMPVLGPDMTSAMIAPRREMASRWVDSWQMPLAPNARGDLAQVAQYLRVRSGAENVVRDQFFEHLEQEIEDRKTKAEKAGDADDAFFDLNTDGGLEATILEVGRRLRQDPDYPYRIAAKIPTSVYVTTAWTTLLEDALHDVGRDPITMHFRWNEGVDPPSAEDYEEPTEERPLVYHLFGRLDEDQSLVLTEDDYFAWLAAWLQKGKDVPTVVQRALLTRSLLFLGFRLDDWDFRVVFHAIKTFGGSAAMKKSQHVGVQLSADSPLIEPEAAQEYLQSYFGLDKVDIYWGEAAGFLRDFRKNTGLET